MSFATLSTLSVDQLLSDRQKVNRLKADFHMALETRARAEPEEMLTTSGLILDILDIFREFLDLARKHATFQGLSAFKYAKSAIENMATLAHNDIQVAFKNMDEFQLDFNHVFSIPRRKVFALFQDIRLVMDDVLNITVVRLERNLTDAFRDYIDETERALAHSQSELIGFWNAIDHGIVEYHRENLATVPSRLAPTAEDSKRCNQDAQGYLSVLEEFRDILRSFTDASRIQNADFQKALQHFYSTEEQRIAIERCLNEYELFVKEILKWLATNSYAINDQTEIFRNLVLDYNFETESMALEKLAQFFREIQEGFAHNTISQTNLSKQLDASLNVAVASVTEEFHMRLKEKVFGIIDNSLQRVKVDIISVYYQIMKYLSTFQNYFDIQANKEETVDMERRAREMAIWRRPYMRLTVLGKVRLVSNTVKNVLCRKL